MEDLVKGRGSWLCDVSDRTGRLQADIQFERATTISYIDLGNCVFPLDNFMLTICIYFGKSNCSRSSCTWYIRWKKGQRINRNSFFAHLIGNAGSVMVSIEVGRSSWPSDKPFVALLPTVALMTPAEWRAGKNSKTVRMFKKGISSNTCRSWKKVKDTGKIILLLFYFNLNHIRKIQQP